MRKQQGLFLRSHPELEHVIKFLVKKLPNYSILQILILFKICTVNSAKDQHSHENPDDPNATVLL